MRENTLFCDDKNSKASGFGVYGYTDILTWKEN